ncbi:hypothetical protein [uncultured Desulfosarcina sp.]|uniref:hypothetical protein n=1 Tax=uncultured Desulfosarcina sp. TaxID=218289 RepID=UPI0029C6D822|nr:hypothetical protein [uncultured Desulfosarcina sp.]
MVMLFCLSMDLVLLGLLLAICIALGMGKAGILRAVSEKRIEKAEAIVGMLSGAAIAGFGTLFLDQS